MLVSCLCPTYNRMPDLRSLLEEAVECFLRQDYPDKELLICNDTPDQNLTFDHPQVKIFNLKNRMATLTGKINYLLTEAQGDAFCRWDDDDIHLPHRLSYSVSKLGGRMEWRADRHWYSEAGVIKKLTLNPGNSHTMALWTRGALARIGGYPKGLSGNEDQKFNEAIAKELGNRDQMIPTESTYYIYRWGTGSQHLSGVGGGSTENPHQSHYNEIGNMPVQPGTFKLRPHWRRDYVKQAGEAFTRSGTH